MSLDVSIVSDFTAAVMLRRRSDGFIWNVTNGGGAQNTYTSSPTYAVAKNAGTAGAGILAGLYTFTFSHANLSDGWHDVLICDDGNAGALMGVQEVYLKGGDQVVVPAPIYHAAIEFNEDDANSRDEYTVTWFKDGVRVTSSITSPTIQVVRRSNGTDLVASTTMTQVGTTGSYKYDATSRVGAGEAALAIVSATIDGATRSFSEIVSRDD